MKLVGLKRIIDEAVEAAGGEESTPALHADVIIFTSNDAEEEDTTDYIIKRIGQFGVKPDITILIEKKEKKDEEGT